MATATDQLGDYTIEDDGEDYILKEPDGNIIHRWDDSAGDWYINDASGNTVIRWNSSAGEIQFNSNALTGVTSLAGLSGTAVTNLEGDNLTVDGSGNLDAVDSRTDVSDGGTTVVSDTSDINFGTGLSVTDDTDGTVTVDSTASGDYSTVSTVTTNTTASDREVVLVDASGGAVTVTLPSPSEAQLVTVKKIDSSTNAATIATPGSETIDGQTSIDITNQYAARETTSDGSNYFII